MFSLCKDLRLYTSTGKCYTNQGLYYIMFLFIFLIETLSSFMHVCLSSQLDYQLFRRSQTMSKLLLTFLYGNGILCKKHAVYKIDFVSCLLHLRWKHLRFTPHFWSQMEYCLDVGLYKNGTKVFLIMVEEAVLSCPLLSPPGLQYYLPDMIPCDTPIPLRKSQKM